MLLVSGNTTDLMAPQDLLENLSLIFFFKLVLTLSCVMHWILIKFWLNVHLRSGIWKITSQ